VILTFLPYFSVKRLYETIVPPGALLEEIRYVGQFFLRKNSTAGAILEEIRYFKTLLRTLYRMFHFFKMKQMKKIQGVLEKFSILFIIFSMGGYGFY